MAPEPMKRMRRGDEKWEWGAGEILGIGLAAALILAAVSWLVPAVEGDKPTPPIQLAQATPTPTPCTLQVRPAVIVEVSASRWPNIADHIADIDQHYPRRLHLDRAGADANRTAALRGYPTRENYDRDEYPPAVSAEGGEGAHVRYAPSGENRSQGSVMGNELEPYCNGSHFRLVLTP